MLGSWKARWDINRIRYIVPPGLYAVGDPSADDPVVVTANYKMTYDLVRRALRGRNVWLLVLETYGINVWCAAGKGTFGTGEVVRRVQKVKLHLVVKNRRLILPILGAAGVCAHEVTRRTGFTVAYATLRATDLPKYLDNGNVTTPEMRELTFSLWERLVLVPVELKAALRPVFGIAAVLSIALTTFYDYPTAMWGAGAFIGAGFAGTVVVPALLPWLPTRSFAVKGAIAGAAWGAAWFSIMGTKAMAPPTVAAAVVVMAAVASFLALNFTGSTPFTSRSGVKKEMRYGLPAMAASLVAALVLWIAGRLA